MEEVGGEEGRDEVGREWLRAVWCEDGGRYTKRGPGIGWWDKYEILRRIYVVTVFLGGRNALRR